MVASRKKKKNAAVGFGVYALGFAGVLCLLVAGVGLWFSLGRERDLATVVETVPPLVEQVVGKPDHVAGPTAAIAGEIAADYYPLEVGRYWVYQRRDPASGAVT